MISRSTDIRTALRRGQRGFLLDPYRFGAAPPAFVGPLDAYTAGLASCGGISRLLSSWSGPLYRVKRLSDSAELDVAADGLGEADTAPMLSWAASATVELVKTYNQTGGSSGDMVPSAAGREARIATSGSLAAADGALYLDGVDDDLISASNFAGGSAMSLFLDLDMRSYVFGAGVGLVAEYGDGSTIGSSGDAIQLQPVSSSQTYLYIGHNAGYSVLQATGSAATSINGATGSIFAKGATPGHASMGYYRSNGIQSTSGNNDVSGGGSAGTFPAAKWRIGRRTDGYPCAISLRRFAMYDVAKSTDAAAICAAIA